MNCIILTYLNIPTFVRDNSDRILVLNASVAAVSAVVFAVIKRILIDWGTAHALVSPIFREVVLSDARERESMKRVKKGVFLVRKGSNMTFNIPKIGKMWEKKKRGHQKFLPRKWKYFPRKKSFGSLGSAEKFFRPPKLGARSPPLLKVYVC